jgi:excisionase family DNA binding protein
MVARREPHRTNKPHTPRTRRNSADDFVTVREAAGTLGVSPSTVWRWVDAGKLPASRVGPRAIRIRRSDVEAAIGPRHLRAAHAGEMRIYTDIKEALRPMTPEEVRRARKALADGAKLGERIRARRKGAPFPDSADIIRQAREERSRQL